MTTSHSHLYRGARLIAQDFTAEPSLAAPLDVLVKFADGSTAEALYSHGSEGPMLVVAEYETAAGTRLNSRTWLLDHTEDHQMKVLGRMP